MVKSANSSIPVVENIKLLGLYVDNKLTWEAHILHIEKKLNVTHYVLLNLKKCVNKNVLITYYNACIKSHLQYAIIIWGSSVHTNKLLLTQKRLIRIMNGSNWSEPCKPIFKTLKIMTIFSLYLYQMSLFVYDHKNEFNTNYRISGLNTRNASAFSLPKHRTTSFERSTEYMGMKIFNHLPMSLKNIDNRNKFKLSAKEYFINNPYYSINEFLNC